MPVTVAMRMSAFSPVGEGGGLLPVKYALPVLYADVCLNSNVYESGLPTPGTAVFLKACALWYVESVHVGGFGARAASAGETDSVTSSGIATEAQPVRDRHFIGWPRSISPRGDEVSCRWNQCDSGMRCVLQGAREGIQKYTNLERKVYHCNQWVLRASLTRTRPRVNDPVLSARIRPLATYEHPRILESALGSSSSRQIVVSPRITAPVVSEALVGQLRTLLKAGAEVSVA